MPPVAAFHCNQQSIDAFDDRGSEPAIPSMSGDYRPQFSWEDTLATTFSPRFHHLLTTVSPADFRFRRLPIAKDLR
jgi:hypothetical protein